MNATSSTGSFVQRAAAGVGAVFGLATIMAGGGVLGGADPGYVVFRPLLIFNTVMGVAYVAAGVTMWRSLRWGKYAAATIFAVNLVVLAVIVSLYMTGREVAIDSVQAMTFRTVVWLALFLAVARTSVRRAHPQS